MFVVLARNGEKKKHEEAAKCGGEKGGSEETAPGANCTKPRQECLEAGPLFLRSRLELISFGHSRKHKPGDGLTCYASSNDIFFFFFSVGERETLKHAPPIFVGRDNWSALSVSIMWKRDRQVSLWERIWDRLYLEVSANALVEEMKFHLPPFLSPSLSPPSLPPSLLHAPPPPPPPTPPVKPLASLSSSLNPTEYRAENGAHHSQNWRTLRGES